MADYIMTEQDKALLSKLLPIDHMIQCIDYTDEYVEKKLDEAAKLIMDAMRYIRKEGLTIEE